MFISNDKSPSVIYLGAGGRPPKSKMSKDPKEQNQSPAVACVWKAARFLDDGRTKGSVKGKKPVTMQCFDCVPNVRVLGT